MTASSGDEEETFIRGVTSLSALVPQRSLRLAWLVVKGVKENGSFSVPSGGVKTSSQISGDRTSMDPRKATEGGQKA